MSCYSTNLQEVLVTPTTGFPAAHGYMVKKFMYFDPIKGM